MDIETRILSGLNESQREAVTAIDGPVIVVAGPGTGKTLTIVRRIAYCIYRGVQPGHVLAVTFTNRAAQEMKERTRTFLGKDSGAVFTGTFHMLGLTIIRDNTPQDFVIYARNEQINFLKTILKDQGGKAQEAAERISRIKNLLTDADREIRPVYEQYQSLLREKNAFDFDDLILTPIEMLGNDALLGKYRDRFRYIIVDEYQDINPAQYRLLRLLAGDKGNICVVGDSDQAIYAFRGADISNFLNFEKDFIGAGRITLSHNYRSTATIVRASDMAIRNNIHRIGRTLDPVRGDGKRITVVSVPDEKAEGEFIVNEIETRIGGTSHYQLLNPRYGEGASDTACSFSDFAVAFRTNAQAETIGEVFETSGIPYQILGNRYHGKGKTIADIIARLREYTGSNNGAVLTAATSVNDLVGKVLEELDVEDAGLSYRFFEDLIRMHIADGKMATLNDILNTLSLLTPLDDFDPRADAVTLMTLHGAKGLEFKVLFLTGVEEGLIPYTLRNGCDDIEEERRLFYVGMTRAKEELFLVHARRRFLYGKDTTPQPSPFIREIPEMFTQKAIVPDKTKKRRKKQMKLF
ncbi:MAG: UvrD-helicase domain-containing protein [Syntrophorhabdaceae bacterium]|nr:UvrD-helicase domain-containing protein [Syntrophorhabdaceae bacterium]